MGQVHQNRRLSRYHAAERNANGSKSTARRCSQIFSDGFPVQQSLLVRSCVARELRGSYQWSLVEVCVVPVSLPPVAGSNSHVVRRRKQKENSGCSCGKQTNSTSSLEVWDSSIQDLCRIERNLQPQTPLQCLSVKSSAFIFTPFVQVTAFHSSGEKFRFFVIGTALTRLATSGRRPDAR